MKIIKHSGDIVDYNPEKLKSSLLKSGAGQLVVKDILRQLEQGIVEGSSTHQI